MEYEKELIGLYDYIINNLKENVFSFDEYTEEQILKLIGTTKDQLLKQLHEKLLIGIKNGYSLEYQINLSKKIFKIL